MRENINQKAAISVFTAISIWIFQNISLIMEMEEDGSGCAR